MTIWLLSNQVIVSIVLRTYLLLCKYNALNTCANLYMHKRMHVCSRTLVHACMHTHTHTHTHTQTNNVVFIDRYYDFYFVNLYYICSLSSSKKHLLHCNNAVHVRMYMYIRCCCVDCKYLLHYKNHYQ